MKYIVQPIYLKLVILHLVQWVCYFKILNSDWLIMTIVCCDWSIASPACRSDCKLKADENVQNKVRANLLVFLLFQIFDFKWLWKEKERKSVVARICIFSFVFSFSDFDFLWSYVNIPSLSLLCVFDIN